MTRIVLFIDRLGGLDQAAASRLGLDRHGLVTPDLFELVVLADGRLHDVEHGRAAVDDDPFAVLFALGAHHL